MIQVNISFFFVHRQQNPHWRRAMIVHLVNRYQMTHRHTNHVWTFYGTRTTNKQKEWQLKWRRHEKKRRRKMKDNIRLATADLERCLCNSIQCSRYILSSVRPLSRRKVQVYYIHAGVCMTHTHGKVCPQLSKLYLLQRAIKSVAQSSEEVSRRQAQYECLIASSRCSVFILPGQYRETGHYMPSTAE